MSKSLTEKVARALTEAVGDGGRVDIEDADGGSIRCIVVSQIFTGQSPSERQRHVWKCLDRHLSPLERMRIVCVITKSPNE